jgi:signal transduction histidine kinase/CheY-like chemotaxis protein
VNGFETKLGDVLPDLFIPEQRDVMRAFMDRALAGERFTVVEEFGRPELGKPHWEITYTPLRDAAGTIIGAFHHAKDITGRLLAEAELAHAQDQLRQSQKMEAMGQLTGGVAHDFNNLLTPIIGSLDLLQRKGAEGERERRLIDAAMQSAERARTLVQRLLAFARRQPLQTQAVDIGTLVGDMADLVASTSGPRVKVEISVAEGLPAAKVDANQIEMAILNLAVNARDAMPDGGTLTISARPAVIAAGERSALQPGCYVCLSIADTGIGMDKATLARAVEPFFSTKGIGRGTGLGLSMVHGLAGQLGGGLFISSEPGFGTCVELYVPASEDAAPHPVLPQPDEAQSPAGIVLLVEDEVLVRLSTADMLAELGYAVVEAASAEEALRLVDEGQHFDLVVTDHLMPGLTGTELVSALRNRGNDVPALLVSGYADVEGVARGIPRLVKPFRQTDLAEAIRELEANGRAERKLA